MEVSSVVGYHDVNNVKARELLQPHLSTDGYYLLRPSSDRKGGVLCTICVTNNNKLMNYRLVRDPSSGQYYIFSHTMFPNIQLLLAYYKTTPINVDVNTLLLHPVVPPDLRPQQREEDGEDAYVVMERPPATNDSDGQIPGLHEFLPKSELNTVMNTYLASDGWYLLRPSSTSEGQLTLAVTHGGKVLNFKINGTDSECYIAPKKRFKSVRALLDFYKMTPIRSKKYANQKIHLLHPIPVDKSQENAFIEKRERKVAKKMSSTNLIPSLPEPWQEFFDERYKRNYYYNPQTQQSSWERPVAPPTSLPTPAPPPVSRSPRLPARSETIQGRPLPATPGTETGGESPKSASRRMSDVSGSMSPRQKRAQQPLPSIPDKVEEPPSRMRQRRNTEHGRNAGRVDPPPAKEAPALPTRGHSDPHIRQGRGSLPALPPKEEDSSRLVPSPLHKTHSMGRSPKVNKRGPVPVPPSEAQQPTTAPKQFVRSSIPSLPPKEPDPEKALPQIPRAQTNGGIPPLPPKEAEPPVSPDAGKPLPPLPPKPASPSPPRAFSPPGVPATLNKKTRKNIVEYEDFPIRNPPKSKSNIPPLPEKEPAISSPPPPPVVATPPPPPPIVNGVPPPPPVMNGSGAPPPPPPPPVGVPVPPPAPPSASPANNRAPSKRSSPPRTQSVSSDDGGRPFTANDLAQAKNLLKKRKEVPESERRPAAASGGFAGVFANAIDSRMMSIRKAMVDSDSGESEFEDVDDEDWD